VTSHAATMYLMMVLPFQRLYHANGKKIISSHKYFWHNSLETQLWFKVVIF